jgi:hypothetical protein
MNAGISSIRTSVASIRTANGTPTPNMHMSDTFADRLAQLRADRNCGTYTLGGGLGEFQPDMPLQVQRRNRVEVRGCDCVVAWFHCWVGHDAGPSLVFNREPPPPFGGLAVLLTWANLGTAG